MPKRAAVLCSIALLFAPPAVAGVEALSTGGKDALLRAISDQRNVSRFYAAVVERHGEVRPFAGVLAAEQRQERELLALCERYGVEAPAVDADAEVAVPDSVAEACQAAAAAERESAGILDELLASVEEPAVRETLARLRTAAAARHLPAFERCAEYGGAFPARSDKPASCQSCGMVGCGCSERAALEERPPDKAPGCGCMRRGQ